MNLFPMKVQEEIISMEEKSSDILDINLCAKHDTETIRRDVKKLKKL